MQRGRVAGKSEVLAGLGSNGILRPCAMGPTSPQVNFLGLMDMMHKETHWSGDPRHLGPERQSKDPSLTATVTEHLLPACPTESP